MRFGNVRLSCQGHLLKHPRHHLLGHLELLLTGELIPFGYGVCVVGIRRHFKRQGRLGVRLRDVVVELDLRAVVGLSNLVVEGNGFPGGRTKASGDLHNFLARLIRRDLSLVAALPDCFNLVSKACLLFFRKESSNRLPGDRLHFTRGHPHAFSCSAVSLKVERKGSVLAGDAVLDLPEVLIHAETLRAHDTHGVSADRMRIDRGGIGVLRVVDVVVEIPYLELRTDFLEHVLHTAVHDDGQCFLQSTRRHVVEPSIRFAGRRLGNAADAAFRRKDVVALGVVHFVVRADPDAGFTQLAGLHQLLKRFSLDVLVIDLVRLASGLECRFVLGRRNGSSCTEVDVKQAFRHGHVEEPVRLRRKDRDDRRRLARSHAIALCPDFRSFVGTVVPQPAAVANLFRNLVVEPHQVVRHPFNRRLRRLRRFSDSLHHAVQTGNRAERIHHLLEEVGRLGSHTHVGPMAHEARIVKQALSHGGLRRKRGRHLLVECGIRFVIGTALFTSSRILVVKVGAAVSTDIRRRTAKHL